MVFWDGLRALRAWALAALLAAVAVLATTAPAAHGLSFWAEYGGPGSGNGEFAFGNGYVNGGDVDGDGDVWIADTDNNRVQELTATGAFKSKFGSCTDASTAQQVCAPSDVAVASDGSLWVVTQVDSGGTHVKHFSQAGAWLGSFGVTGTGDGQLSWPQGIDVDAGGNVYVSDYSQSRVQKFSSAGTFLAKHGVAGSSSTIGLSSPRDIAVLGDHLYVLDNGNERVRRLDLATLTGSTNWSIVPPGSTGANATGLAAAAGKVYVSDTVNGNYGAVRIYSTAGTLLRTFASCCEGDPFRPWGLAVASTGWELYAMQDEGSRATVVHWHNVPPIAAFTVSPVSQEAYSGESFTLTSTSTDPDGSIVAVRWDLDNDGQFDDHTGSPATKSFPAPGSYTVGLQVEDDDGQTVSTTKTLTVINRPPTASFTVAPGSPLTGVEVTFTSTSSDLDGSIATTQWDLDNDGLFDDGSATTATHTFTTPGNKTVRLRVVDNSGAPATTQTVIAVQNRPPTGDFTFDPPSPLSGTSVAFSATGDDPDGSDPGLVYAWDLDNDGQFDDATGPTPSHVFATSGTKTVKLRITDVDGGSVTVTKSVVVQNRPPTISIARSPDAPLTGEPVTFTATAADPDGTVSSIAWDLDDNGQFDDATGATATRTFTGAGSTTVRSRATDNSAAATVATTTFTVAANQPPTVSFGFAPAAPTTGQEVTFTATPTDPDGRPVTLAWDLDGDGEFDDASGVTAARTYTTPGPVTVRVRVTDSGGTVVTAEQAVPIANRPPDGTVSGPGSVVAGQTATFSATVSDPDGTVTTIAWDLDGDGEFDDATGTSASRVFPTAGTFPVKATITDANGASVVRSFSLTVTPAPVAPVPDKPIVDAAKVTPPTTVSGASAVKGIPLRLECAEACSVKAVLLLSKKDAKRARIKTKAIPGGVPVGTGSTRSSGAGKLVLKIKLDRSARAKFVRAKMRRVRLNMRITLRDLAGNPLTIDRTIVIRIRLR